MTNSVDPDQTVPIGKIKSWSTLFASTLKFVSNVRQFVEADDFSRLSSREPRPRAQSIIAYNDVCHELRAMCQAYASLRLTWRIAQLLLTTNTLIHMLGREGGCIRPRKSH